MTTTMPYRGSRRLWLLSAMALLGVGCGGSSSATQPVDPFGDPGVLLGGWDAITAQHTGRVKTHLSFDVIAEGGGFTLSVDSRGAYEARIVLILETVEVGMLEVRGAEVRFRPSSPPGPESTAAIEVRADTVELTGESTFDLDGDGEVDVTNLLLVLVPSG